MKYLLKSLSTNNRDLKTSILFQVDDKAYLFNCPDGLQRLCLQNKVKFSRIKYVFFSQLSPDYFSGFPGFYLSTREQLNSTDLSGFSMNVVGPYGLRTLLTKAKSFIGTLNYIKIKEFQTNNIGNVNEESKENSPNSKQIQVFNDDLLTVIPIKAKSTEQNEKDSYSFIGIPKQARGKFLANEARNLGCNHTHFKLLNEGSSVTLEDGNIVYPFQVFADPIPSQAFILIFLPNTNYVDSFLQDNENQFKQYYQNNIDEKYVNIAVMYHSVPLQCILNQQYREFVGKFGSNVKHIFDCVESNDEVISRQRSYVLTRRQSLVCPQVIPLSPLALNNYEQKNSQQVKEQYDKIDYIHSKLGLSYDMYPLNTKGFDYSNVIQQKDLSSQGEESVMTELNHLIKGLKEIQTQSQISEFNQENFKDMNSDFDLEPQILFLGTVSMKPCQYRNASAIMLMVNNQHILMDCAEGSYGQLYDHFQDINKVNEVLMNLRVVFITHIHGDHQLGIIKIMSERDKLIEQFDNKNKLYIVTPTPMMDWMEQFRTEYLKFPQMVELVPSNSMNPETTMYYSEDQVEAQSKLFQNKKAEKPESPKCPERSYEEVNQIIKNFKYNNNPKAKEMIEVLQNTMGISNLLSIENDHCIESYACLIESEKFGRIFYSGDTAPCQNVINYAQKVKLLIHEATFEDALQADAHYKKHTTTGQAMDIAEKCQPWRTVLTHFSPRYQKLAEIQERHISTKTMVAFDHMRLKLSYFEWTYQLLEIYSRVFTNEDSLDTVQQTQYQKSKQPQKKQKTASKQ